MMRCFQGDRKMKHGKKCKIDKYTLILIVLLLLLTGLVIAWKLPQKEDRYIHVGIAVYDRSDTFMESYIRELDFRIEPPSKSILDNFDHYTAAVVIVDRWYKHEGHTIAYSLSFIPIELVGRLQIDLNSTDALLEFLEHTCYEQGHHCSRCVTYSTAGNFSAKNYKLSSHDSFLMTQENVYDENEEILVVSKHYIPAEVFELKFSI